MCTVTWVRRADQLDLFFSRDEALTRAPAEPPRRARCPVPYLAPVDPEGGGSWISVNTYGVCLALLNGYSQRNKADAVSRGSLITSLSSSKCLEDLDRGVSTLRLESYNSFFLLALSRLGGEVLYEWSGDRLLKDASPSSRLPFSTSSVRTDEVLAWRRRRFEELVGAAPQVSTLQQYHMSWHAEDPAMGVCMDRADARTVSLTHIQAKPELVSLRYAPRISGEPFFGQAVEVILKATQ